MQRHAVADWRDRHIVAAAALVNLRATEACAAFEGELEDPEFRGPMLDAARVAGARIDAYLRRSLAPDLDQFRFDAASELAAIHDRLRALADGLRIAPLEMPEAGFESTESRSPEPDVQPLETEGDEVPSVPDAPWFARLPGVVVGGAARVVESASIATGVTIFERSGAADRLRKAAKRRVQQAWMNDDDTHPSLLSKMITLIDGSAHAARTTLS